MTVVNALTIDVEEYFQIHAFSNVILPKDWNSFEPGVERSTYRLLDLLDSSNGPQTTARPGSPQADHEGGEKPRATFFILGWIAERHPRLVKDIQARGHEIACHGYTHQLIFKHSKEEFKEDVRKAKEILEDLTGVEVVGYRAPTYSVNKNTLWALEILFGLGFRYDSSIFPIKHDFYGFSEAPRFPFFIDFSNDDILSQLQDPKYLHEHKENKNTNNEEAHCSMPHAPSPMRSDRFVEFPLTTISIFGLNLPCSGGGYFRLLPYSYSRWGLKKINEECRKPVIFYIHPWELDPATPKINSPSCFSRFRTYVNLQSAEHRFSRLLEQFRFAPLVSLLDSNT